jgi:CYTH domain-containing protein
VAHHMSKIESHLEIERKFLVAEADLSTAEGVTLTSVETTYLDVGAMSKIDPNLGEDDGQREIRVSKRTSSEGKVKYKTTSKVGGCTLVREESESEIDKDSYERAIQKFGKARMAKKRFKFKYLRKEFALDILDAPGIAVLEVELESENEPVVLPPFVIIKKEVTGDPNYYNVNIAKPLDRGTIREGLV